MRGVQEVLEQLVSFNDGEVRVSKLHDGALCHVADRRSAAMLPAASVSGLYFAHPQARYFTVGRLGDDQIASYARRKGRSLEDIERWLGPNLAYQPVRV